MEWIAGRDYDIYQCTSNCGNDVYVNGTKECKASCDDNTYLYESKKICYLTCFSTDKQFSTVKSASDRQRYVIISVMVMIYTMEVIKFVVQIVTI